MPPLEPTGPTSHYVISSIEVPSNAAEARQFGLDLDGNGTIDNGLGALFGALEGLGFTMVEATDAAVGRGDIALQLDVQGGPDSITHVAGLTLELPGSRAQLVGTVSANAFAAGPGALSIEIALGFTDLAQTMTSRVVLDLVGARVAAPAFDQIGTADGPVLVAGAITEDNIGNEFVPALAPTLQPFVTRDCTTTGPGCGCVANSLGAYIVELLGATASSCIVTVVDTEQSSYVVSLLRPDVTIDGKPALSFGMRVVAAPAAQ